MKIKKLIVFKMLLFFSLVNGFGQNFYEVLEGPIPNTKNLSSFTINIIGYNQDFVMAEWENYINELNGLTYLNSVYKGVIDTTVKNIKFPILNNQIVNLHTRFSPNSSLTGILVSVWIEKQDGSFFSSKENLDKAKQIKNWLLGFQNWMRQINTRMILNKNSFKPIRPPY